MSFLQAGQCFARYKSLLIVTPEIKFPLQELQRFTIYVVCIVTVSDIKVHDFTFLSVESHLLLFRQLANPV